MLTKTTIPMIPMTTIKADSHALLTLVKEKGDMFADVDEDIDMLALLEFRRVARNHSVTLGLVRELIEEIHNDLESVDRYRLDEVIFQLVSPSVCDRFKKYVLKKNVDNIAQELYNEIIESRGGNMIHYINSLEDF